MATSTPTSFSIGPVTDTGPNTRRQAQVHTQTQTRSQPQSLNQPQGSSTQTMTTNPTSPTPPENESLVLRLRGAHDPDSISTSFSTSEDSSQGGNRRQQRRRHIQWDSNVIDNEGLGRKKSKVCCIYHKPRAVGESSDESSSSSSDDSDSDSDCDSKPDGNASDSDSVMDGARPAKGTTRRKRQRRPSPNAYEKMPRYDVRPLSEQPGA